MLWVGDMVQAQAGELLNQKDGENTSARPIFAATERLAAALDRLEHCLGNATAWHERDVHQHARLAQFERENTELRREREKLDGAISQLRTQYDDLHKVASTIYGKLDDSIRRLNTIIEE